ncbi:MAG: hypothetical protein FJ279_17935 [Planctomycetes bacterium]|nr:hypothetical protein [Planctomycetota bacterium]MBM4079195.1 hypothetical protein [Planctomycetota bacterium]
MAIAEEPLIIFADDFIERVNIAWRVEQGRKDPKNPLLTPRYPWDAAGPFSHGTVLKDPLDGLWKMWNISTSLNMPYDAYDHHRQLTYAFSEDGVNWVRPELGICSYEGYAKTNILLDFASGGKCSMASVLINPESPTDRRYEMFIFREPWHNNPSGRIKGLPLPAGQQKHPYGLYRYFSDDGLHWRPVEGPVKLKTSDSLFVYNDLGLEHRYVAYHKTEIPVFPGGLVPYDVAGGGLRILARRTSADGTTWSDPFQIMIAPDWRDPQDTQFMELAPIRQGQGLVATLTTYHNLNQEIDLQFAASPDGVKWWRPIPRRPCLTLEPLGDYGGGMLWPMRRMVDDGDRLYLYYAGLEGLHGNLYAREPKCLQFLGGVCRASWEKGRLWAAVPSVGGPSEAVLTTRLQEAAGKRLFINAVTLDDGELTAELLDSERKPVPGFTRKDCIPFRGDSKRSMLRWTDADRCAVPKAYVRFCLKRSRLYGYEFNV